ncbi:hypothetical protein MUK42_34272 [Musa troglodytarum]|uniref:Uncharacterized protein n=1 Tax=Musa troglodytarum TaxID=320322 RepID=A0A9E7H0B4_9LILI|nr:hypothetical protein MUK42_34272 [Musa troglodytarum]
MQSSPEEEEEENVIEGFGQTASLPCSPNTVCEKCYRHRSLQIQKWWSEGSSPKASPLLANPSNASRTLEPKRGGIEGNTQRWLGMEARKHRKEAVQGLRQTGWGLLHSPQRRQAMPVIKKPSLKFPTHSDPLKKTSPFPTASLLLLSYSFLLLLSLSLSLSHSLVVLLYKEPGVALCCLA